MSQFYCQCFEKFKTYLAKFEHFSFTFIKIYITKDTNVWRKTWKVIIVQQCIRFSNSKNKIKVLFPKVFYN
ncbi:hypothetical protein TBCH5v1_0465 [Thermococcus barophilus]|uniref:Uncharacterized protein n=1 Tax=Thermococcus barophilus TaxID=55802 RepID=A0A0S1X9J2_THEBA|nr:hypothetical protein TBCH5v1_0465 [Thermococcus barophilus]